MNVDRFEIRLSGSGGQGIILASIIERRFFTVLLDALGILEIDVADQFDSGKWDKHKSIFTETFKTKTRDEWCDLLEGTDACVAPVLSMTEAPQHPHNKARQNFVTIDGIEQPAPAPRFSRTESTIQHAPAERDARQVLQDWGMDESDLRKLKI